MLRLIKIWATNRGIYTNLFGYLGGISWAILVNKVCQMFPNYSFSHLLIAFFEVYSEWSFPCFPVCIAAPTHSQTLKGSCLPNGQFNLAVDGSSMMVVTPTYP